MGAALLFFGPAMGHVYAGNPGQATSGVLLRGSAVAATTAGLFLALDEAFGGGGNGDGGAILFLGGGAVFTFSAIHDIVTAPRAARRYNARHGLLVSIGPAVSRGGAGVGLAARF